MLKSPLPLWVSARAQKFSNQQTKNSKFVGVLVLGSFVDRLKRYLQYFVLHLTYHKCQDFIIEK